MNRRDILKLALAAIPCQALEAAPRLEIGELDPDARYMVVVNPGPDAPADDWRWRREISEEIRDCWQAAGFERGDVGILFLRGYGIEVRRVTS